MVLDPPRQQVNVNRITIFMFIPFLNYYAFWRIQKFWFAMGVGLGWTGVMMLVSLMGNAMSLFESDTGIIMICILPIAIGVNVLLLRRWARKYNEKIAESNPTPDGLPSPQSPS